MRDPNDPGTVDMLPAKIGRPCNDPMVGPMTQAERARRYRERRAVRSSKVAYGRQRDLDAADLTTVRLLDAAGRLAADIDRNPLASGVTARKKRLASILQTLNDRYS